MPEAPSSLPTPFDVGTVDWYRAHFNIASVALNAVAEVSPESLSEELAPQVLEATPRRLLEEARESLTELAAFVQKTLSAETGLSDYQDSIRFPTAVLILGWVIDAEKCGIDVEALLQTAKHIAAPYVHHEGTPIQRARAIALGIAEATPNVDAQTRYSLACVFASVEDWDEAAINLARCFLLDARMPRWAKVDPLFTAMKKREPQLWQSVVQGTDAEEAPEKNKTGARGTSGRTADGATSSNEAHRFRDFIKNVVRSATDVAEELTQESDASETRES